MKIMCKKLSIETGQIAAILADNLLYSWYNQRNTASEGYLSITCDLAAIAHEIAKKSAPVPVGGTHWDEYIERYNKRTKSNADNWEDWVLIEAKRLIKKHHGIDVTIDSIWKYKPA